MSVRLRNSQELLQLITRFVRDLPSIDVKGNTYEEKYQNRLEDFAELMIRTAKWVGFPTDALRYLPWIVDPSCLYIHPIKIDELCNEIEKQLNSKVITERKTGKYTWDSLHLTDADIQENGFNVILTFNYHGSMDNSYLERLGQSIVSYLTYGRESQDEIESILKEIPNTKRFVLPTDFKQSLETIYNETIYDNVDIQLNPSGERAINIILDNATVLDPETKLRESFFDQLDDEIYERKRDGDYETPEECCNCGADCSIVGGTVIRGDLYCPDCARRELDD